MNNTRGSLRRYMRVNMTVAQKEAVETEARKLGCSGSEIVRRLIDEGLKLQPASVDAPREHTGT